MKEKAIENSIIEYLNKFANFYVFGVNNQPTYNQKRGCYQAMNTRYTPYGVSDIIGTGDGRALYIEVKKPEEYKYIAKHYETLKNGVWEKGDRRLRFQTQIIFLERHRNLGAIAFFADSMTRALAELRDCGAIRGKL